MPLFSANISAGNPGKNLVESFVVDPARGGCILDRDAEDVWRRSGGGGGGGGIGGSRPATAAAAARAFADIWGPLRGRPEKYCGT